MIDGIEPALPQDAPAVNRSVSRCSTAPVTGSPCTISQNPGGPPRYFSSSPWWKLQTPCRGRSGCRLSECRIPGAAGRPVHELQWPPDPPHRSVLLHALFAELHSAGVARRPAGRRSVPGAWRAGRSGAAPPPVQRGAPTVLGGSGSCPSGGVTHTTGRTPGTASNCSGPAAASVGPRPVGQQRPPAIPAQPCSRCCSTSV